MKFKNGLLALLCVGLLLPVLSSCNSQKAPAHRLQWWLDDLNWSERRTKQDGAGITIAVLDTGIDATHPDLAGKISEEYRVPSLGEIPKEHDLSHGTAVAGVLCAEPATEKGALGIAPKATILSVDITDSAEGIVDTAALIAGFEYAISKNVDIINVSLGLREDKEELKKVTNQAKSAGIIVVAAAGNGMDDNVLFPAKYDGAFCVGAKGKKGELISPRKDVYDTIFMPGEYIVTTDAGERQYTSTNGTSSAAPMLSGLIALILQKKANVTIEEIQNCLTNSAQQPLNIQQVLAQI
ncbi:MAG: S8 family serine peptidase [Oscillospiraceae bacterium]|jgi:subtilisin/minor extracellular protease Epr|nr:S8 family serine peptidase [Oscillospiraceae bacterium]